jgi:acyl-CoA dehydrogenase
LSDGDAVAAARRIASGVAAKGAARADHEAAFPGDTIAALDGAGLLAAVVPVPAGGLGLGVDVLAAIAAELARGCGSSAMIWAMHQLQLACLGRHGGLDSPPLARLLSALRADGTLLASATSEQGTGGDLGRSLACVRPDGEGYLLEKDSPTVSYGEQAGGFLISARRDPGADDDDQVAVITGRDQVSLEPRGSWNPMGMRGTCSRGFLLRARFGPGQILADPFGVVATHTLIPMSEILWSAVWIGLATEALARAARCAGERAARSGAAVTDHRLGRADHILTGLEAQLGDAITRFEAVERGEAEASRWLRARLHALKLAASTSTIEIVQLALAICGFAGYQEHGQYSVARLLRDLYSAQVMVSNDRLLEGNAAHAAQARADQCR